jgi:methionyl-tRNA formyltransferase
MAGETETGVTTFFLEQKVDTGTMILQRSLPIEPDDTAGDVHDRMMELGAEVVLETVQRIINDEVNPFAQDDVLATSAPKIFKEDCRIDWTRPARVVHNHIRGLSPYPGAWTLHGGTQVKIFAGRPIEGEGSPGCILDATARLIAACGEGAMEILEVQQEGRRRMPAEDFLRGYEIEAGDILR